MVKTSLVLTRNPLHCILRRNYKLAIQISLGSRCEHAEIEGSPWRDPRARLPPWRRHGEQAALEPQVRRGPGREAFPRPEGEEGLHRRRTLSNHSTSSSSWVRNESIGSSVRPVSTLERPISASFSPWRARISSSCLSRSSASLYSFSPRIMRSHPLIFVFVVRVRFLND